MKNRIRQRNTLRLVTGLLALLLVAGCAAGNETPDIGATAAAMADVLVEEQLTQLALANPTETPIPPTITPETTPTFTMIVPTLTTAPQVNLTQLCLSATLASETVADDTIMEPGEYFEKSWTLANTGTCTWTDEYAIVFHHGDSMNASTSVNLPGYVAPGASFTFSLFMNAPLTAGSHTGFYMLQSPDGIFFGVGENANIPIYVRIVVPGATPTSKPRSARMDSGGTVYEDGKTDSTLWIGDNAANEGAQGFATFTFGNIPQNATITAVIMDLTTYTIKGDPFAGGCLYVNQANYGGIDANDYDMSNLGTLWAFCSTSDFTSTHYGDATVINAVQDALTTGQIQLQYQYDWGSNNNDTPDALLPVPVLHIYWYAP